MHIFDYESAPSALLTPEITELVGAIREYKGKQELYLNARVDVFDALMEVAGGTSDAAVIDSLMAAAMVGEGTDYEGLGYTLPLNDEEYGVGFRKGSDLAAELNAFLTAAYADGTIAAIAETYGVTAAIIPQ